MRTGGYPSSFKLGKEFYESIIITYPFDEIIAKKV